MADQSESEDILSSEDVETLPADNLEVPTNFNWINSRKGYDYFCQVLERISAPSLISVNVISKSNETESTMAKTLLTSSENHIHDVLGFLYELSSCFSHCYEQVQCIKCMKNKMIMLETKFMCLSDDESLQQRWDCLISSCGIENNSIAKAALFNHILQHFWSCLVLYESHGYGYLNEGNDEPDEPNLSNISGYSATSDTFSTDNIEMEAIREHAGWACKRVRDTFKDGPQTCKIQVSKTNSSCVLVGKQYLMELIKRLGEDKLVQPGKFLFFPISEIVPFFVYLHTAVEDVVGKKLKEHAEKSLLRYCLQVLSESQELREMWSNVLVKSEDKLFNAASIMILQRIVAMFVKSKQQIIREQLQLKARKQSTSLRQTLKKAKSDKIIKKQQTGKEEVKQYQCVSDFRQNSDDPAHIVMFLDNTFTNPAEAPEILNRLHGKELSNILK